MTMAVFDITNPDHALLGWSNAHTWPRTRMADLITDQLDRGGIEPAHDLAALVLCEPGNRRLRSLHAKTKKRHNRRPLPGYDVVASKSSRGVRMMQSRVPQTQALRALDLWFFEAIEDPTPVHHIRLHIDGRLSGQVEKLTALLAVVLAWTDSPSDVAGVDELQALLHEIWPMFDGPKRPLTS